MSSDGMSACAVCTGTPALASDNRKRGMRAVRQACTHAGVQHSFMEKAEQAHARAGGQVGPRYLAAAQLRQVAYPRDLLTGQAAHAGQRRSHRRLSHALSDIPATKQACAADHWSVR